MAGHEGTPLGPCLSRTCNPVSRKVRRPYPSDLTNIEWKVLQARLVEKNVRCLWRRKHDLRELLNAISYLLRTGCSWRMLPHDLPPWETIYSQVRSWKSRGIWEVIHRTLCESARSHPLAALDKIQPSRVLLFESAGNSTHAGDGWPMERPCGPPKEGPFPVSRGKALNHTA